MAIELIDKIKQKNNGSFKLLDAIDVELKDGSDLQSFIDNIDDKITGLPLPESGKCNSVVSSDEEPTDEKALIWIDTSENEDFYGDTLEDKIIEEFRAMFKNLSNAISELKAKNIALEARIAFLEENGSNGGIITPPSPDDTSRAEILVMEDGSVLVDELGNILAFNIISNNNTSSAEVLTTEDGSTLIDELGNILAFNVTSNVDSTNDTVLITEKNEVLITENNEILKF